MKLFTTSVLNALNPELSNLSDILLPSSPNIGNTLYGDSDQLNNTAQFYMLAMSQRAKAQEQAGSRQ